MVTHLVQRELERFDLFGGLLELPPPLDRVLLGLHQPLPQQVSVLDVPAVLGVPRGSNERSGRSYSGSYDRPDIGCFHSFSVVFRSLEGARQRSTDSDPSPIPGLMTRESDRSDDRLCTLCITPPQR